MRMIPITAAAALALLTGVASAQNSATPMSPRSPAPGATAPAPPRLAQNPLTQEDTSNIGGTAVYGNDGQKIGSVSTVLMDPQSKKIDRLVVNSGGVLGVGGHRVALPVEGFAWDAEKGAFKLPETVASIKTMPEWVEGAEITATGSSPPARGEPRIPPAGAGDSNSR